MGRVSAPRGHGHRGTLGQHLQLDLVVAAGAKELADAERQEVVAVVGAELVVGGDQPTVALVVLPGRLRAARGQLEVPDVLSSGVLRGAGDGVGVDGGATQTRACPDTRRQASPCVRTAGDKGMTALPGEALIPRDCPGFTA